MVSWVGDEPPECAACAGAMVVDHRPLIDRDNDVFDIDTDSTEFDIDELLDELGVDETTNDFTNTSDPWGGGDEDVIRYSRPKRADQLTGRDEPCAHEQLEKSLPENQRGGPHMLVCNCPKCRPIC